MGRMGPNLLASLFDAHAAALALYARQWCDGPEDIVLRLSGASADPVELRAHPPGAGLPVYAHVLLDVLRGTRALSTSADEAEQAWRIVSPVLEAWENGDVELEEYPAGSAGPQT